MPRKGRKSAAASRLPSKVLTEATQHEAGKLDERAEGEARQGIQIWRSVGKVVTLAVPIRAPGVLSQLLGEMRSGKISDAMWTLYLSRILTPDDPRLRAAPFSTSPMNYVVFRHRIRAMRSFRSVMGG